MRYYTEAFRADGSQILGNLDGQTVIKARNYKRSAAYKFLVHPGMGRPRYTQVHHWNLVDESGKVLETINNKEHRG